MKPKTLVSVMFAFILIFAVPVTFWNIEITMEFKDGIYLTNGFRDFDAMQAYHIKMYVLIIVAFYIGYLLIDYAIKDEKQVFVYQIKDMK